MKINSLGYLCMESPQAYEWAHFGPEVLGMARTQDPLGRDDTIALTVDDRPGRLQVSVGERNRLRCVGWELANADAFHDAIIELEKAGVEVQPGSDEDRKRAQVRDLARFEDPAGLTHEIFWGQFVVPGSFLPGRPMSGFITGAEGLGHVVLVVPDLGAALTFYKDLLGFTVSDEIDLMGNRVIFFHVNPRHHTLAVMEIPGMRGLHHLMIQTAELDAVGSAYDICQQRGLKFAMTLGRHTNDKMVSFYVRSPAGFEVEYGWGASTVEDEEGWTVTYMDSPSIWGHQLGDAPPPECIEPAVAAIEEVL
jgi:extradiol dioxygenase